MIPSDVHEMISDSYRLYLSLALLRETGGDGYVHHRSLRDHEGPPGCGARVGGELSKRSLLLFFPAVPTSPIKWSDVTSQNLVDCARYSIPVEYISMPLSGFMAPVTLVGTVVQHTAETLSGIVITQLTQSRCTGAVRRVTGRLRCSLRDDAHGGRRDDDDRLRIQ